MTGAPRTGQDPEIRTIAAERSCLRGIRLFSAHDGGVA